MRNLSSWPRFTAAAVLLAATALLLALRNRIELLPTHEALSSFPPQIGNRLARDLPLSADELEVLGPGQFLLRDYLSATNEPPINLFIAFFPSQRSGDTIHSPKNCIPGSGWTPISSGYLGVQLPDGSSIVVNRYIIAKGTDRDLVLYWYQGRGRITPSEYRAKILLVSDAIRRNRTDGALVRVAVPIVDNAELAQGRGLDFIRQIWPILDKYIPR